MLGYGFNFMRTGNIIIYTEMRINMKLEYNLGRYSLKVLNKSHSIDVLDFY